MFQQLTVAGYLGKDPETRYLPNGDEVCNFSIGTTEKWKDQSGEKQEHTEWFRCSAFGKLAEICGEWLKKGSPVLVTGTIKTRKWTDKDGVDRYTPDVRLTTMKMLPSGERREGGERPAERPAQRPRDLADAPPSVRTPPRPTGGSFDDMDDDIPF